MVKQSALKNQIQRQSVKNPSSEAYGENRLQSEFPSILQHTPSEASILSTSSKAGDRNHASNLR